MIRIATRAGGKTTEADKTLLRKVATVLHKAKSDVGVRKETPLYICDEWTWNDHLKMNPQSIAHCDGSGKLFLRKDAFKHEIGRDISLYDLLKHELIHAKLGKKEKVAHGPEFKKVAKKAGLPKKHWVKG